MRRKQTEVSEVWFGWLVFIGEAAVPEAVTCTNSNWLLAACARSVRAVSYAPLPTSLAPSKLC